MELTLFEVDKTWCTLEESPERTIKAVLSSLGDDGLRRMRSWILKLKKQLVGVWAEKTGFCLEKVQQIVDLPSWIWIVGYAAEPDWLMMLAGWCHMIRGCEEAICGIMDWCADSPTRTECGIGKVESLKKRRERPVSCEKHDFVACPVNWLNANFGNDVMNEPPSISTIPSHLPSGHHLLT